MQMNALRIRLALMGSGVLALLLYLAAGGRLGPDDRGTVQIEYGAYPEGFEGLQVAIDGKPAGFLRSYGAATRTGFLVKEGRHLVQVVGARYSCRPSVVTIESGRSAMLLLDVADAVGRDPNGKTPLELR